jgi:hypothetical protein
MTGLQNGLPVWAGIFWAIPPMAFCFAAVARPSVFQAQRTACSGDQVQAWLHADVRLRSWLAAAVAVTVAVTSRRSPSPYCGHSALDAAAPNTIRGARIPANP